MADIHENSSVSRVSDDEKSNNSGEQSGSDSSGQGSGGKKKGGKTDKKKKTETKSDKANDEKGGEDEKSGLSKKAQKAAELEQKKANMMKKLQQIQMAAQVGYQGVRFMWMAKLLAWLKMMMQMALCVLQGIAQMGILGFLNMVAQAAIQFVVNVVTTIAGWLGTTVVAAAVIATIPVVSVLVAVAVFVSSMIAGPAQRDDLYECNTDASFMHGAPGEFAPDEVETAKRAYAFLKAYGLPDVNIAGILGNWSDESGIDPTGVELIYTEPRMIPAPGTKKGELWYGSYEKPVWDASGNMSWTTTSPANFMLKSTENGVSYGLRTYAGTMITRSYLSNYSDAHPIIQYLGIGLGQWTNDRHINLMNYADAHDGFEWYDLELQLMFMIDHNGGDTSGQSFLESWTEAATPTDAAKEFCASWERIPWEPERGTAAENWYIQIGTWVAGIDYDLDSAESLVGSIMAAGSAASNRTGAGALRSCTGYTISSNSDLVQAILSYAWGPGEAYTNDGTDCWKTLFNAIIGASDGYYRCCDRTVAVAVRWSGTDSDFPYAGTTAQLEYLLTSPRWQEIPWGGDPANLVPGDILIRNDHVSLGVPIGTGVRHIVMYVGNDAIVQRFGETYNGIDVRAAGYCIVSGSINTNSPHVQRFTTTGSESNQLQTYKCFRNVEKFNNRPDWTNLTCVSGTDPGLVMEPGMV